jgi:hypothetical protein
MVHAWERCHDACQIGQIGQIGQICEWCHDAHMQISLQRFTDCPALTRSPSSSLSPRATTTRTQCRRGSGPPSALAASCLSSISWRAPRLCTSSSPSARCTAMDTASWGCVSPSVRMSVLLPACPPARPPARPSVGVCLPVCLPACLSVCLSVFLSVTLNMHPALTADSHTSLPIRRCGCRGRRRLT